MGIRSVSSWMISSLTLLVVVACGGGDKGVSTSPPPPATIEGVWIQTQHENKDPMGKTRVIRVERFQSTILVKGNAYSFYEDTKEVEKGELTFDGNALHTKNATNGQKIATPVRSLTHDTLTIGDADNTTVYKRATEAEFNQYLGIVEQADGVPSEVPQGPEVEESLEGFWALKESREASLIVRAKPGELIFKVVSGQFESYEMGKLTEKGTIAYNGLEITSVSDHGTTVAKVTSFGKVRGLVVEEETNGKKKGKTFKRITEAEFNALMKGEEPPQVEPNKEETPASPDESETKDDGSSSEEIEMETNRDTEVETEGEMEESAQ